jgi:alpha-tubulin suppressor-like RCC1 family protein
MRARSLLQLGDGTTTDRSTPPSTYVITNAAVITAGRDYTCALLSSSSVVCWGINIYGQVRR